jgi:hypothetical protein
MAQAVPSRYTFNAHSIFDIRLLKGEMQDMIFKSIRLYQVLAGTALPFIISFAAAQTDSETQMSQLLPREKFTLHLSKIFVSVDDENKEFDGVHIEFPGSDDQVFIGKYYDMYIKRTPGGTQKTIYQESYEKSGCLSQFDKETISKVNKEFITSLEIFEKMLKKENWGRCLYLDSFFPRFLSGYYYMICAAYNSSGALPGAALVPENEFDVSLNSPKSDTRIDSWRSSPDNISKLLIASENLAGQLKEWQKNLDRLKENEDVLDSVGPAESFANFINVYFNTKPLFPVTLKEGR